MAAACFSTFIVCLTSYGQTAPKEHGPCRGRWRFGIGPEWVHLRQKGRSANSLAGEAAGDFMFWPMGKHRYGGYLEPAYDYSFAAGHQKSLGISFGLLICVR
jgi:hypothetical protein